MRSLFMAALLLLAATATHAQPLVQWSKCFGGTDLEEAKAIRQTTDGGYIFAGLTASSDGQVTGKHPFYDCWVVKMNAIGAITWQKALGGGASEGAHNIRQTPDGGYIMTGYSQSSDGDLTANHGLMDFWVVKLSGTGSILWQRSYGSSAVDMPMDIISTADGGYIVAGFSEGADGDVTLNHGGEDYWILKISSAGAIEWQRTFGGSGEDLATAIRQTADGGYLVGGYSASADGDVVGNHGGMDFWILKLSSTGALLWQKSLGGSADDVCGYEFSPGALDTTSDGGCIVAGWSASSDGDVALNHGDFDYWIVKLSATGSIIWQKTLGGSGDDEANSIQQTSDGGYIVAGVSNSADGDVSGGHGGFDFWLVKMDGTGAVQWKKSMGGNALGLGECAHCVQQTADNGFIVGGFAESVNGDVVGNHGAYDFWAVKLLCSKGITGPSSVCVNSAIVLADSTVGGTWSAGAGAAVGATGSYTAAVTGLAAGTASVTYTVANSCGTSMPVKVFTVNPLPVPVIINTGLTMTTTVPYVSYQWIAGSVPMPGATNGVFTAASYGGGYRVVVTDTNGCSDTSAVKRLERNNEVVEVGLPGPVLYPNPAQSAIYVSGAPGGIVMLYDAQGTLVRSGTAAGLDIADLPPGWYNARVLMPDGNTILRTTIFRQ